MDMKQFSQAMNEHFMKAMVSTGKLFRADIDNNLLWENYLKYTGEEDTIFRQENSHKCNHCMNFIRRYGNIIAIAEDGSIVTLFGVPGVTGEYEVMARELDKLIQTAGIANVFAETKEMLNSLPYQVIKRDTEVYRLGFLNNTKVYSPGEAAAGIIQVEANKEYLFHHMYLDVPKEFIDASGKSEAAIMSDARGAKEVFERGLTEIGPGVITTVIELITQDSILDSRQHIDKLTSYLGKQEEFNKLNPNEKESWLWKESNSYPYARLRSELIGTLCVDITMCGDEDITGAVNAYNVRIDPINHNRATKPLTESQKKAAIKLVKDLGYEESFTRRFANIDDIKVTEINHINSGDGKLKNVSIFDTVPTAKKGSKEMSSSSNEIGIDDFMSQVVPNSESIELMISAKHEGNFVTLTTSTDEETKRIFGWDNNYSWTYNGGYSGKSRIADAVSKAGGNIDAVLRFSITWNEGGSDIVDLDAHAVEPGGNEIYYGNNRGDRQTSYHVSAQSGNLDVDMIDPVDLGVENITWTDLSKMRDGDFKLFVRNFNHKTNTGFKAEVAYGGSTYTYEYVGNVQRDIEVTRVNLKKGVFTRKDSLEATEVVKDIWGVKTNEFHKVKLVSTSPNYWGDNKVGNKHYFFFLENCKVDTPIKSFHPDQLNGELKPARKMLEVFSQITQLNPSEEEQLAGVGFNATVRDEVIAKVDGKLYTIKF